MEGMGRHSFAIGEHDFLLDGEPHRVISGALHYFRIHPDQWRDRIRMGRMMGLNTIETYVAWKLAIENDRWRGVPFSLRTGPRLTGRVTAFALHI